MKINPTPSGLGVSALEEKKPGMPNIYNALVVKGRNTDGELINVTCEVQQLLRNNRVRSVAMSATDGLKRGMKVIHTGAALSVPDYSGELKWVKKSLSWN
ncbi:hypothetical protein MKX03_003689 [Papaver bracteatum]|nr:hypothetical protein MKX03_003689 [Papaver bracteatum]